MMIIKQEVIPGIILILTTLAWLLAPFSPAAALDITEVMVTDVTPASFCVVSITSEEVSGKIRIEIYQDRNGLYPVSSYNIIEVPCTDTSIFNQAASKGINKIKVEGLSDSTDYYFRFSATSILDPNVTAVYPSDNTLHGVTTEKEASLSKQEEGREIRLKNNLLAADFYLEDKITAADHTLVIAGVEGASYPISAFVGEGTDSPLCVFDLHNLFCGTLHTTLKPTPGSSILFYHYNGSVRTAIRRFFIPATLPEDEAIFPVGITQQITLSQGLNYISFQVDPQNSEEIHSVLHGKYTEIWTYENGTWIDLMQDSTYIFRPSLGYHITTTEPLAITAIGGWRVDEIPLNEGLNIVGYRSDMPVPVEEAMAPLVGKYTRIWGYDNGQWASYDPKLPDALNTLTQILPGRAYYIFAKESGVCW